MSLHISLSSLCICNVTLIGNAYKLLDVYCSGCNLPRVLKYFLNDSLNFLITRALADPFGNSVSHQLGGYVTLQLCMHTLSTSADYIG